MSICDPNNPDIDPDQCCHSDSPSTMVTAANWLADDDSEQACCGIHGQICPAVIDGTLYENAFFYPYNCTTVFAHGTSCSDTIGHEFTHGVDFSEKQLNLCKASDANGLYCRHEEAMMEGIPIPERGHLVDAQRRPGLLHATPILGQPWRCRPCDDHRLVQHVPGR
jgi:hypothetical protein